MKIKFMAVMMTAFAWVFSACGSKDSEAKQLVLYYSQTGSTKTVAEEINPEDIGYGHRSHRTGESIYGNVR